MTPQSTIPQARSHAQRGIACLAQYSRLNLPTIQPITNDVAPSNDMDCLMYTFDEAVESVSASASASVDVRGLVGSRVRCLGAKIKTVKDVWKIEILHKQMVITIALDIAEHIEL